MPQIQRLLSMSMKVHHEPNHSCLSHEINCEGKLFINAGGFSECLIELHDKGVVKVSLNALVSNSVFIKVLILCRYFCCYLINFQRCVKSSC